jgi:hypothetical protein
MLKTRLPGFTAQYSLSRANTRYHKAGAAACVGGIFISSIAPMLGVTTDDCLGRGLCAYVDTKGHVTCAPCPGQGRAFAFGANWLPDSFTFSRRVG